MSTQPMPPAATESTVRQLSWKSFCLALAVTLGIFFGLHPLWKPLDMDAMDRTIGWSYAPIPLLVLALLALEHKLRWSSFLLETVRLTLVKFVITFLVANTLWLFVAPPARNATPAARVPPAQQEGQFEVRDPPPATPIEAARTGRLAGLVVDAAGKPAAGVLVAVTDGLQGIVFAPRPEGVVLTHDGTGVQPRQAVILVYERLVLRGAGALHSVSAVDAAGKPVFNVALVPEAERTLMFHRALGRLTLSCAVHGKVEHDAELAVVDNPFAAWTGEDGRFSFDGVPAGELQLTASQSPVSEVHRPVSLAPGAALTNLQFTLP